LPQVIGICQVWCYYDELKSFLEREDTIFQLLIGKDPRIAISQQEKIKIKDPSYTF